MNFLNHDLREGGGYDYKKAIVDTFLTIINEIAEAKELGLSLLCEFIEDCEYAQLSTRILHVLGQEGPKTSTPSKFIRFIYNRVILESAVVRAAAVTSLAKFGLCVESLRQSSLILIRRCLKDNDDEVRDRATYYLALLQQEKEYQQKNANIELPVPLVNLEKGIQSYLSMNIEGSFDISKVPTEVIETAEEKEAKAKIAAAQKRKLKLQGQLKVPLMNTLLPFFLFQNLLLLENYSQVLNLLNSLNQKLNIQLHV